MFYLTLYSTFYRTFNLLNLLCPWSVDFRFIIFGRLDYFYPHNTILGFDQYPSYKASRVLKDIDLSLNWSLECSIYRLNLTWSCTLPLLPASFFPFRLPSPTWHFPPLSALLSEYQVSFPFCWCGSLFVCFCYI